MSQFNSSIYQLKNGSYQVSYYNPITRNRHRPSFKTKQEAKQYQQSLEKKFIQKDYSHFCNAPIGFIVEEHLRDYPESKLTSRTRVFREFYNEFKNSRLEDLSTDVLKRWLETLRVKYNYSESTMLKAKICINVLFKYLEDKGVIPRSPLSSIRYARRYSPKKARIHLSKDELKAIITNAQTWYKRDCDLDYFYTYLYIIIHTGARRSEVLKLLWEDVNFELGEITFRETKTGDDRTIKMSPQLQDLLKHIQVRGHNVITNKYGKPVHRNMCTRHLQLFRQRFPNGKDWGYHALRHSFAYHYLKDGGNMYQLQSILGHHKITTTIDIYGKIQAKDDEKPSPYNF